MEIENTSSLRPILVLIESDDHFSNFVQIFCSHILSGVRSFCYTKSFCKFHYPYITKARVQECVSAILVFLVKKSKECCRIRNNCVNCIFLENFKTGVYFLNNNAICKWICSFNFFILGIVYNPVFVFSKHIFFYFKKRKCTAKKNSYLSSVLSVPKLSNG